MSFQNKKYLSQKELCEHLTSKLRNFNNVTINIREIKNNKSLLYSIDVKNRNLCNYLNGVFHSISLRTVSHPSRIINIKIVFNDNVQRNNDIWINADAITQIFREIANTTKDNGKENKTLSAIKIEEFEDERNNKHLAVIAESVRGASLIYTYLKSIEFVKAINQKYSSIGDTSTTIDLNNIEINDDMTQDEIKKKKQIYQNGLKILKELENSKNISSNDEPLNKFSPVRTQYLTQKKNTRHKYKNDTNSTIKTNETELINDKTVNNNISMNINQ